MKKVVIADPHPLTIKGVTTSLSNTEDFIIVGFVTDGNELFNCLQSTRPDILILELNIPGISGFHALRHIREKFPKTKIAIFSSHPEKIYGQRSIKSGASGYIAKTVSKETFIQAIQRISIGGIFLKDFQSSKKKSRYGNQDTSIAGRYKKLSTREVEVLNLLSNGKRNKDIAKLLELNEKTISTYKARLLKKLEVSSLADLINQARMLQFT